MPVKLKTIKFNHNTNSITTDAITIRKNKTQTVGVPEWVDGVNVLAEDSKAAYAMLETNGKTITIQANFQLINSDASRAQIRAIDATTDPRNQGGCIGWLIYLLLTIIKAIFGNVLGDVKARWVNFNNGTSAYETFELVNPKIWSTGVGIHFTEWQWQYRFGPKGKWHNMQISKHKIYIILEAPKSAWNQTAGSDHLPWTEVLDYSCSWALAAKTKDEAATKITNAVYDLGNSVITYDCPGGGSTHYSFPTFNCTKFLERLKGAAGNGQYINCTDCATIVSTFSNILGCDLWASRMQSSFKLNPLLAIGSNIWQTACGWSGFSYHEVAWKGNCGADDEIFDACLQVDADANPTIAPHTGLLPVNMKFGDCNTMDYRLRLSPGVSGGCVNCAPAPATKIRRTIS
jgi:hypothetical protein